MIYIKTNADRIPEAVRFIDKKLEEIGQYLHGLDYSEDVNGNLIYTPGFYSEERQPYEDEKTHLEIIRRILTCSPKSTVPDW